jgi:hypothetical protein
MSTAVEPQRTSWDGVEMSVEQFLALPDDGIHRELINGRVREERDGAGLEERVLEQRSARLPQLNTGRASLACFCRSFSR